MIENRADFKEPEEIPCVIVKERIESEITHENAANGVDDEGSPHVVIMRDHEIENKISFSNEEKSVKLILKEDEKERNGTKRIPREQAITVCEIVDVYPYKSAACDSVA